MGEGTPVYPKGEGEKPRALEAHDHVGERRFSPSIGRNKDAVRAAVLEQIRHDGALLEIGSGTGEHGVYITEAAPGLDWTFTEYSDQALPGIRAWIDHAARARLHGPHQIDASSEHWGDTIESQRFNALFSANVIHISPFAVARGLFFGAARLLMPEGKLLLYGPFARDGFMAEGNRNFDADLKRRDATWGVRDVEQELKPLAAKHGLRLANITPMPANNLTLVFERC